MKITYKLVGTKEQLEIVKEIDRSKLNYSACVADFKEYGFDKSFEKIIFICRSKKLVDDSVEFTSDIQQVFIFSKDLEVKMKMLQLFKDNGMKVKRPSGSSSSLTVGRVSKPNTPSNFTVLPQQDLKKPIEQKIPSLEDDEMIEHNESIVKKLLNPDFVTLMKIYKEKPELLATAFNYVNSGSLVDITDIAELEVEKLEEKEQEVYQKVKSIFTKYNYVVEDETLFKLIRHFKGNVSLIFRYVYQMNLSKDE